MSLTYTSSDQEGISVIALDGNLIDQNEALSLGESISETIDKGQTRFVLDMGGIPYMNSTGLNVLINLLTKARNKGGELILANLTDKVKDLYMITKLDTIFKIEKDVADAIEHINEK